MKKFLIAYSDHFIQRALDVTLRDLQYQTTHAYDGLEAIDQALDEPPDAIILSTHLPGLNGLDVARALRALSTTRHIPILFITSDAGDTAEVKQAALARVDWLQAPLDLPNVRERLTHLAQTNPAAAPDEVTPDPPDVSAISDPLTGLYARQYMFHRLTYEAARAARYGHDLAAIVLGIDGLDHIRARHGPAEGDRAVVAVANVLRRKLRVVDIVGYTASDEFLIIAPHTDAAGARALTTRLQAAVREAFKPLGASARSVSLLAGIANSSHANLSDNLALFARAQAALDRARREDEPGIAEG